MLNQAKSAQSDDSDKSLMLMDSIDATKASIFVLVLIIQIIVAITTLYYKIFMAAKAVESRIMLQDQKLRQLDKIKSELQELLLKRQSISQDSDLVCISPSVL